MNNSYHQEEYLKLFLDELDEQVQNLEKEILKLEENADQETIESVFRIVHTIKGNSKAIGFENLAVLTHHLENILEDVRSDSLILNADIIELILKCIDRIQIIKNSIVKSEENNINILDLIQALKKFEQNKSEVSPPDKTSHNFTEKKNSHVAEKTLESGEENFDIASLSKKCGAEQLEQLKEISKNTPLFYARIKLAKDCSMKYPRAFIVIQTILEKGEVIFTLPPIEAIKNEEFGQEFEIFFTSNLDVKSIQHLLEHIYEISSIFVIPWMRENLHPIEYDPQHVPMTSQEQANINIEDQPEEKSSLSAVPFQDEEKVLMKNVTEPQTKVQKEIEEKSAKIESPQSVRVDVSHLDVMMNLVGELIVDRTQIDNLKSNFDAKDLTSKSRGLYETFDHISQVTNDLKDQVMKIRIMPLTTIFDRFPRIVRDIAHHLKKEVRLEMTGGDVELDRSVIEVMDQPFIHIIRNALDHGIESPEERERLGKPRQGLIQIMARRVEDYIQVEIADDGAGIDIEKIKKTALEKGLLSQTTLQKMEDKEVLSLIFVNGLSTASEVSELSGRGVGMDVVRSNVLHLGGNIEIDSRKGKGSKFTLLFPLTLAVIKGLLVRCNENTFVIPLKDIVEMLYVKPSQIQKLQHEEAVIFREHTVPLFYLKTIFETKGNEQNSCDLQRCLVVIEMDGQYVGLVVDQLIAEQEVVIKSLSYYCGQVRGISGLTLLGDGTIALVLDVRSLLFSIWKGNLGILKKEVA